MKMRGARVLERNGGQRGWAFCCRQNLGFRLKILCSRGSIAQFISFLYAGACVR
jgi:hypothetical protein